MDDVYVAARGALLDALEALTPHFAAVTLVGAQAIYLRVGEAHVAVAAATTDGDLALDPEQLRDAPPLERLMREAGFQRKRGEGGELLVGIWAKTVNVAAGAQVTVDLLMPEGVAPASGRRAARLAGHETGSVLKVPGLESALVDADVMQVAALDPDDRRAQGVRVAGPAALLIAKVHKILDREERPSRLKDKDALDVFRLLRGTPTADMVRRCSLILADGRSADSAREALGAFRGLFSGIGSAGVQMALRSTEGLMDSDELTASLTALAGDLLSSVNGL